MADPSVDRALRFLYGDSMPEGPLPKVRHAFPAYRVFLCGFEVTEDITAINIKNHVGNQPNTCSITLLSERDKYLMTTEDMLWLTGIDASQVQVRSRDLGNKVRVSGLDERVSDLAAQRASKYVSTDTTRLDYRLSNPESVKSQLFFLKQSHAKILVDNVDAKGNTVGKIHRTRYPYADGVPLFHPNDPLRIFVRDPFDPTTWYYGFSGLLTDITDDCSVNNQKVLTIAAEDPTKLFRYARVYANPGLIDAANRTPADQAQYSAFSNPLSNKTLTEIIDFIVFGTQREPVFETLLIAPPDMTEADAQKRAIEMGLIGDVDTTRYSPTASIEEIRATLTPAQKAALDSYIERRSNDRDRLGEIQQEAFVVDYINRFGDKVMRRFGISGIGSFKPARDIDRQALRQTVEQEIQSFRATPQIQGTLLVQRIAARARSGALTTDLTEQEQRAVADAINQNRDQRTVQQVAQNRVSDARLALESPCVGAHVYGLSIQGGEPLPDGIEPVSLQQWEGIVSWPVRRDDVHTMLNKDTDESDYRAKMERRLGKPFYDATIEDFITLIGEDPVNFPVDGGRVFVLLPAGAESIGNDVVGLELVQSYSMKSESQNFLQLLYDALARIEFVFYATPKGDLVVEFPLYDFDPDDLGVYERNYLVELDDQFASSSTFSDAAVRTIAAVAPQPTRHTQTGNEIAANLPDVVVKLPAMFPVYGTRQERGNTKGRIRTEEAARIYANIMLNKVNADAHSVGLPLVPRFSCGLNRPYLWKLRNHIGTSADVSHSMAWNGGWRTSIGLRYMRGWTGMMTADNKMIYVPLSGQASRSLNYRVLFGAQPDSTTPDANESDEVRRDREATLQQAATRVPIQDRQLEQQLIDGDVIV